MEHQWDENKITRNRLTPSDNIFDVIEKMTDFVHGAGDFLNGMVNREQFMEINMCDDLELYGGELYLFWKDCCQGNFDKTSDLLYKYHLGKISKNFIKKHITEMGGLPIKTFDEWVKSSKSLCEFYQPGDMVAEDVITFLSGLGEEAVIKREILLQRRSCQTAHKDENGKVTPLFTTFKQAAGSVWIYVGECAKLEDNFCAVCPCSSCLRSMDDGSKDDCHACDICFDGDVSPLVRNCTIRGDNLLKVLTPSRVPNFYYKGEFIHAELPEVN